MPRDWNRRSGRLHHTWLRTVESDLAPLNIGLATAYHRAQNRQAWSTGQATCTMMMTCILAPPLAYYGDGIRISYHIVSYRIVSYRSIVSYRIVSYRIVSYHIISYHIISYHIISYQHHFIWRHSTSAQWRLTHNVQLTNAIKTVNKIRRIIKTEAL